MASIKDLLGKRITVKGAKPTNTPTDSSDDDLFKRLGYKVVKIGGKEVFFPTNVSSEDVKSFMEYWKNQYNTNSFMDDGQRNIIYEIYKKLDEELSEVTMTLDTYADEMFCTGFVDNPIEIEFKGIDKEVEKNVREVLKRNGVLSNYRSAGRELCKFGDIAYKINMPKNGDYKDSTLTLMSPDKWKVLLTDKENNVINGYSLKDTGTDRTNNSSYYSAPSYTVYGDKEELKPHEFVQFTIYDNKSFPYGRSLLDGLKNAADHLMTVEALLALSRASKVERMILKVPVEGADPVSAFAQMSTLKSQWKNILFKDSSGNNKTANKTPSLQDILVMPNIQGLELDKMQSSIDLSSIEDVEYFRDKFLLGTRLPKGYFVSDESRYMGGNALSVMDLKFARGLIPYQRGFSDGLSKMCLILCYYGHKHEGKPLDLEKADVGVKIKKPTQIASDLLNSYVKVVETADKLLSTYKSYINEEEKTKLDTDLSLKNDETPSFGEDSDTSIRNSNDLNNGVSKEMYIDLLVKLGLPENVASVFSNSKAQTTKEKLELSLLKESSKSRGFLETNTDDILCLKEKQFLYEKIKSTDETLRNTL